MSWVLDCSESTLGSRLVLLAIANHADKYGRNSYASVPTLAAEARLSERQAQRSIAELKKIGELKQSGKKVLAADKVTNIYELPKMADRGDILASPTGVGVTPASPPGVTPTSPKPSLLTVPPKGGRGNNATFRLVQLWKRDFRQQFGTDYVETPGDWSAAKRILATVPTPEDVVEVARAAWGKKGRDFWACENKTSSLSEFVTNWNKVKAELSKGKPSPAPDASRYGPGGPQQF